jgi:tRNA A37 threonylcarbamoyladenosine dehydratase
MNFILVDSSRVEYSNLNRQLLYTAGDVDLRKVDVAASFLGSLTDGISVECIYATITDENIEELLGSHKIDYIIEAVDNLSAKATLIKYAHKHNIPIIVSAGISGRLDPTLIDITPLDKTRDDASARNIRQFCIKENIDTREVMCVHSKEHPLQERSDVPNYMIMVPAAAGLFICYYIVQHYIEKLADEKAD